MKRILFLCFLFACATAAIAQTTLSGRHIINDNLKIFSSSQAWAEGIVIVGSDWSGLRLARTDPAYGNFNGNWALGYNINTGDDLSFSHQYSGTQYDYLFHISSATRNVGIGTSTPQEKFFVNSGNIGLQNGGTYGDWWGKWQKFGEYTSSNYGQAVMWDSDGMFVGLEDNGTNKKDAVITWWDDNDDVLRFKFGTTEIARMTNAGMALGVNFVPSGYKMAIGGKLITEEVKVKLQSSGWPDYVFRPRYKLRPLSEIETFIGQNGHLPEIPSAADVEKNGGIELADMNAKLLKKIEELTLYLIEQDKKMSQLGKEVAELKKAGKK